MKQGDTFEYLGRTYRVASRPAPLGPSSEGLFARQGSSESVEAFVYKRPVIGFGERIVEESTFTRLWWQDNVFGEGFQDFLNDPSNHPWPYENT